jgi:hypothetical protein
MRYNELREEFERALREARFFPVQLHATETIDVGTTDRHYEVLVGYELPQRAKPFLGTATVSFRWDPAESARTHTTEEDLLTTLLGRRDRLPRTTRRWQRVDITMRAMLPHGSTVPMPDAHAWGPWAADVDTRLEPLLPKADSGGRGREMAVAGWRNDVKVEARVTPDKILCLDGVEVSAFREVAPPRVTDNPDRRPEGNIRRQLVDVARRFRGAFEAWMDCVSELRRVLKMPEIH